MKQRTLRGLLDRIIQKFGLLLDHEARKEIETLQRCSAAEFSELVLKAEGRNPETDRLQLRAVHSAFIEYFGQDEFPESTLSFEEAN